MIAKTQRLSALFRLRSMMLPAAAASAFGLAPYGARGLDAVWTNNASSAWATAANWSPNSVPGTNSGTASADAAIFYDAALSAARTVTVDSARNVKSLLFTNSTAGFTFQLSGGSLLLSAGGRIELTGAATANVQTYLNTPITLEGSGAILNNGGNTAPTVNNLEFQSGAAISGAAGLGSLSLTLGGTNGNFSAKALMASVISDGAGNALTVVKQDSGVWQFNGANTYSGGLLIKQGGVIVGNNSGLGGAGSGAVALGDSLVGQDVQIVTGSGITVGNPIVVSPGGGGRILSHLGGNGNGVFSGLVTLSNEVVLRNFSGNSTRTLAFSGAFGGKGNIIISNSGAGAGNTTTISGSVTNVGGLANVSALGDALVSGAIGATCTGVVQASATSTLTLASSANAFTAETVIDAGTLKLGPAGSIAGSTNITVAAGAVFDVSAVTGGFVLGAGQTLQGVGSVNGNVTAPVGARILPAAAGAAGMLTFNNNLVISGGTNFTLDVSASSGGGNDQVSIGGTLAASGAVSLKALGGATALDTAADYVLMTAGGISGGFASTPVWVGTVPANAANFSIVTGASQVSLHYNPSVPPAVVAFANSNALVRGQTFRVTALVTPGSLASASAITAVTMDLSFIGGPSVASLVLSNNNVWTNSCIVAGGSSLGGTVLSVTATDASGLQGSFGIPFTVFLGMETWNGQGGDAFWGTAGNWSSGLAPLPGDYVIFDGGSRTAPLLEAGYSLSGLTFSSGASAFSVGQPGGNAITLAGGLTNNSANSQTVGAPVVLSGGGSLPFNTAAGNLVLSGALSDDGYGFVKLGAHALTLAAQNGYSGIAVISNGVLSLSGAGTLGNGSADLMLAGSGAAVDLGGSSQAVGVATVAGGVLTNGVLNAGGFELQGGAILADLGGSGAVARKSSTNHLILWGTNTFDGGFVISNSGAGLCLNGGNVLGTGLVDISQGGNGASFDCTAAAPVSNVNNNAMSLSGNFTFVGSQGLNLGAGNANMGTYFDKNITVLSNWLEFAGNIYSGGTRTLSKDGAGALILSGACSYMGPTSVNAGALYVMGSLDANGGTVTVASNAVLSGTGLIDRPVVVNAGGTLSPGAAIGVLTLNSGLTLSGNLGLKVNKALAVSNDLISVTGPLTNAGQGRLMVSNLNQARPLALGDTFIVLSQPLPGGGSLLITPAPGAGLAWTNRLAVDGSIAVIGGVATSPTNIVSACAGGKLTLSWPADHTGWTLQSQTNALGIGLSNNWVDVQGSAMTNSVTLPVPATNAAVFFRLKY
jgi:autotransporter-associated beta strand protein